VVSFNDLLHDHGQATGKLYHLRLRVECTLFCNLQNRERTHAVLMIGLYEFELSRSASSTTKTGRHDIAEILLKVALNTKNQIKSNQIYI
jgi:hypothetical protein